MEKPAALAAFAAGIVSFLSPCVLPLVPGYISYVSGLSLEELSRGHNERALRRTFIGSLFFVLGFSLFFTALGASASAVGRLLASHAAALSKIAGAVIIIFGLHTTGLISIRWLYYERRLSLAGIPSSPLGAFLMGLAFACGWTPCIGPILASILALAAVQETVGQGMRLLWIYSMGLGLPFLATSLGVSSFLRFFARYKRYIRWGEIAAGALLILVGTMIFFNKLTLLIQWLPRSLFRFAL